jgi:hypothetical protein
METKAALILQTGKNARLFRVTQQHLTIFEIK